ncbi:RDD family [Rhodococcus gordoniae]|uniref:RDD family n=1 Tax=Rhodococcus gordoniae TaxID=223392 RepID=A0A379LYQ4_9NOCA|nr:MULTISPECIES: RDD family protein [Rhodococcus]UTT47195.1 RDD family protein [Rhodococcus gordoniae]SUE14473.1 RDD family [Rhodococcus gordoniae]
MARMTGSWLSGPAAALPQGLRQEQDYPGQLLGLPEHGPGSMVPTSRRVLALVIDWFMAMAIAAGLVGGNPLESPLLSSYTLIIWFVVGVGCVSLFSFTPGQFVAGLQVARVDAPVRVGIVRALARQVLLVFIAPALVTDVDGRGLQDRATGTAVVRSR